jgi:hypothetical protein
VDLSCCRLTIGRFATTFCELLPGPQGHGLLRPALFAARSGWDHRSAASGIEICVGPFARQYAAIAVTQAGMSSAALSIMRSSSSGDNPSNDSPFSSPQSARMGNRSWPSRQSPYQGFLAPFISEILDIWPGHVAAKERTGTCPTQYMIPVTSSSSDTAG